MALEYKATDLPGKILYNKEFSIQIRSITPIEQKYILSLSQKEQKTNRDYVEFLKKLVMIDNPQMTFEELYWFDVQYLLYRIRYLTYPKHPIKLGFKCHSCGEPVEQALDMGALEIATPENVQNTITLDNLGEFKIRNKLMCDDITIEEFSKKMGFDMEDLQLRLLLLDLCLISDNGRKIEELYSLAEQGEITADDIFKVEKWFETNIWGVKEHVNIKCPHCQKEASRGYLLSIEDFFSIV